MKRGTVTTVGDAEIQASGGSEEFEVSAWWESLSDAERLRVGRACGADYDELCEYWEDLSPVGQQMRIHMWYDERGGFSVIL